MSENYRGSGEFLSPTQAVATALHDWLAEEIISSSQNRNAYLDSIEAFWKDGPQKSSSHFGRLRMWTLAFAELQSDKAVALQTYGALTGLSGAFRHQCFMLAHNQNDYYARRFKGYPLGVNIQNQIISRLEQHFGTLPSSYDLKKPVVSLDNLIQDTHATNELRYETIQDFHTNPRPDRALWKVNSLIRLQRLQRAWLDVVTDTILFAVQARGGNLATIPFMEPKPITEAEVEYPLKNLVGNL